MLETYQKPAKRRTKRLSARENYHILRLLNRIPVRYTMWSDYTDEEKDKSRASAVRSITKRRKTDKKFAAHTYRLNYEYSQRVAGRVKTCSKCNKVKAWSAFDKRDPKQSRTKWQWHDYTSKYTLRPECKQCRKEYNREQYRKRIQKC
jgi:hypothetical protein